MKPTKKAITCLMGVVLITMVAAITARAAAPALNGQIVLRPLTPEDLRPSAWAHRSISKPK